MTITFDIPKSKISEDIIKTIMSKHLGSLPKEKMEIEVNAMEGIQEYKFDKLLVKITIKDEEENND